MPDALRHRAGRVVRAQHLYVWSEPTGAPAPGRERGQFQAPPDGAVKGSFGGKPIEPFAARDLAHGSWLIAPPGEQRRKGVDVPLGHPDAEPVPAWALGWHPIVREDHGSAAEHHRFEEPEGGGAASARAEDEGTVQGRTCVPGAELRGREGSPGAVGDRLAL